MAAQTKKKYKENLKRERDEEKAKNKRHNYDFKFIYSGMINFKE